MDGTISRVAVLSSAARVMKKMLAMTSRLPSADTSRSVWLTGLVSIPRILERVLITTVGAVRVSPTRHVCLPT